MIDAERTAAIAADVMKGFLGLDIDPAPGAALPRPRRDGAFSACISLTGAWSGGVILVASPALARRAAAVAFDRADSDVTEEEAGDVVGEIANMMAGRVKQLVPGPTQLSLPMVAVGDSYDVNIPAAHTLSETLFRCGGHVFGVIVVARGGDANSGKVFGA